MILIPCARTISHPASCKPTEQHNQSNTLNLAQFCKYYASSPAKRCEEIELKCLVRLSLRSIVGPRPQSRALPPKAIVGADNRLVGRSQASASLGLGGANCGLPVQLVQPMAKLESPKSEQRANRSSPRIEQIPNYVDTDNQADASELCEPKTGELRLEPKSHSRGQSKQLCPSLLVAPANGLKPTAEPELQLLATPCNPNARPISLLSSIQLINDSPINGPDSSRMATTIAATTTTTTTTATAIATATADHAFVGRGPSVYFVRRRPMIMISYCRSEAKNYALALKKSLENLHNCVDIYLDLDEICCGQDWHDSLNRAVLQCDLFVALITRTYGETLWTSRELKLADQFGKPIVPVNFDQVWPPKSLAIQLATRQFIEWKSGRKSKRFSQSRLRHDELQARPTSVEGRLRSPRWPPKQVERVAGEIYSSLGRFYGSQPVVRSSLGYAEPSQLSYTRLEIESGSGSKSGFGFGSGSASANASPGSSLDSSSLDPFRANPHSGQLGKKFGRNRLGSVKRRRLLPMTQHTHSCHLAAVQISRPLVANCDELASRQCRQSEPHSSGACNGACEQVCSSSLGVHSKHNWSWRSESSASSSQSEHAAARGGRLRTLWHRILGRSLKLVEPDL